MSNTLYYDKNAPALKEQYDALEPENLHKGWLDWLPQAGLACDIGAGSGRDARWLAAKGWDVIAVEPSQGMRSLAAETPHPNITWLNDALPELPTLRSLGHRFNLILVNAVFMHLLASQRKRAFRILAELLAPSGVLVVVVRRGSDENENQSRGFHTISIEELQSLGRDRAIAEVASFSRPDTLRAHVNWDTVIFQMPDDGTGSLSLLRHIIVNDNKSSSYKLGLLRVLTRLAESAPGIVLKRSDEYVDIPLGAVALYWIKLHKPLVLTHKIPLLPGEKQRYGFAGPDFYALDTTSNYDIRIGAHFNNDMSATIIGALGQACKNIKEMPANYITYPGQSQQIFQCERSTVSKTSKPVILSKDFLSKFGTFRIPANLWQTLGQYACWLDPAIVNEWRKLTQGWMITHYSAVDPAVFEWAEGIRDTRLASQAAARLQSEDIKIRCTWSNARVKQPHIDHCFPWSRWYNNDLWNLLPTKGSVNSSKGDKLPSASTMHNARPRILQWWEQAYVSGSLKEQFFLEVEASLPYLQNEQPTLEDVFTAVQYQRVKLKADQQLVEWSPFGMSD